MTSEKKPEHECKHVNIAHTHMHAHRLYKGDVPLIDAGSTSRRRSIHASQCCPDDVDGFSSLEARPMCEGECVSPCVGVHR